MKVSRALLSVSDRLGVVDFARGLAGLDVEIVATSGTRAQLLEAGVPALSVSDVTGFSDGFMHGRVKTLQAPLYAGILAERDDDDHIRDLQVRNIGLIDLVCVNLYPFGRTDQDEMRDEEAIRHIDIGGPMLIRAAALNHRHVAVVVRPAIYAELLATLRDNDGVLPERLLGRLAAQAFAHVASYEAAVSAWFSDRFGSLGEVVD